MITMDSIFNAFLITLFICAGFCIAVFVITMVVFKLSERKERKEFDGRTISDDNNDLNEQ